MSYSVIKTWIPGEILTASDLNASFSNDIAACNDLDSRVTVEVTARTVLEAEHDALAANVWDGANTCIAADKVKALSILNDAVTSAKILAGNVTTSKLADGVLTATTDGRLKMADLFITNAKVNDVGGAKLTGNAPAGFVAAGGLADGAVNTTAKLAASIVSSSKISKTSTYGTQDIGAYGNWVPPEGIYNISSLGVVTDLYFQVYSGSSWVGGALISGLILCDGVNIRILNNGATTKTVVYRKMD